MTDESCERRCHFPTLERFQMWLDSRTVLRITLPIYRSNATVESALLCIGEGEVLQSSGDPAVSERDESWVLNFCGGCGGFCSKDQVCVASDFISWSETAFTLGVCFVS
jgi:hypothetical protein